MVINVKLFLMNKLILNTSLSYYNFDVTCPNPQYSTGSVSYTKT